MKSPKEIVQEKLVEKHVNRTGMALSPKLAAELLEVTQKTVPSSPGDETGIATVRAAYARDGGPIGSVPPPATMRGVAKTAMKAVVGENANVLLDKMGARLAFERTGARLYEAIIGKLAIGPAFEGGPTLERLQQILREEQGHFDMLREAIVAMGGDPTAVTPAANVEAVLSMGAPQVLADARTDLPQSLEAILLAELTDNDGWTVLIELARTLGQDELAARFEVALRHEEEHLRDVRAWVRAAALGKAGRKGKETVAAARS